MPAYQKLILLLVVLALQACQPAPASPTPLKPTATASLPPTLTRTLPSPTATPLPSKTPLPTRTPTVTKTPTPTPPTDVNISELPPGDYLVYEYWPSSVVEKKAVFISNLDKTYQLNLGSNDSDLAMIFLPRKIIFP